MTYETALYLTSYFPRLMTRAEYAAKQHAFGQSKLNSLSEKMRAISEDKFKEQGWLSNDDKVIALSDQGYEQFILDTAARITRDSSEEFYLNLCPKCQALARTPYARQCRHCRHAWHDTVAGSLQFESSFRITGHGYFITGEITSGVISIGDRLDLSHFQMNLFPKIIAIEYTHLSSDDSRIALPALGFNLTNKEEYLVKTFLRKTAIDLQVLKANE